MSARSISVVVAAGVVLLAGCASTPNMRTASHVRGEYSFTRKEPVVVALPPNSSVDDEAVLDVAKIEMPKQGFQLVDDVNEADRIVTYRVSTNVVSESNLSLTKATVSSSGMDIGDDAIKWSEVSRITTVDSGYTMIRAVMLDLTHAAQNEFPMIWEAWIMVPDDTFIAYPEHVFNGLLKLYGRNEVREGRFKPPFESKDKKKK